MIGGQGISGFHAAAVPEPVAEPLVGLRSWTMTNFGVEATGPAEAHVNDGEATIHGQLAGTFMTQFRWGRGVNEAACLRPPVLSDSVWAARERARHESELIPQNCACGFWAYGKDRRVNYPTSMFHPGHLDGVIEGWGRLVVGPNGFRCQKARIVALMVPKRTEEWNRDLRDRLGVLYPGVELYPTRAAMLEAHPLSDMAAYLPEPEPEPDPPYGGSVEAGQMIGRVGSTGNSTGPIIHHTAAPLAPEPILSPAGWARFVRWLLS